MTVRPRVLFVARTRLRLPLEPTLDRRYEALGRALELHQLASRDAGGTATDPRFTLAPPFPVRRLDGLAFQLLLPFRIARALRRLDPEVTIVQGASETALALLARRLAGARTAVVADIHGDWRVSTRLYGSPARRLLNPVADALARLAIRRADGVRTITAFTSGLVRDLGVEPTAEFPAYMDFTVFTRHPVAALPATPTALFVGVLETYKGLDVLAAAWPGVLRRVPGARLRVVGQGVLAETVDRLAAAYPGAVSHEARLAPHEVAAALDDATVLVLPSRGEGMGRVVVEALCRGRGVVGTRSGGIPDVVEDGTTGLLVPPDDVEALADALVAVLGDVPTAERLGAAAADASADWVVSADAFAARTRALVEAAWAARCARRGAGR